MIDKKITRISAAAVFAALFIILILPIGESGRIAAATLLVPSAVLISIFVKKRSILSINTNQVILILTITALVYVMLYYLTGLEFGFFKNPYKLTVNNFFLFALPITAIVVCTEIVRNVLVAQEDKLTELIAYFIGVVSEVLIVSSMARVTTFSHFMEIIVSTLLPALMENILYNYLIKRYGIYPNLSFRLITTLYAYTLPIISGMAESLVGFFKLVTPLIIYFFIDSLFEKKRKYALGNKSRLKMIASRIFTVLSLAIMILVVMLVSNHFRYGSLVIATESMTGEINKGDIVIFEKYEEQTLEEGQVIVFEKDGSMIVHRITDIEIINGIAQYHTKGDANDDEDAGYVTDPEIVGVAGFKLPGFGYPTLWMRSLFKR